MSRGFGAVQKRVLEMFAASPDWMPDSIEVACAVFECNPVSISQVVNVRRALRSLAAAGAIVNMQRRWIGGRRKWCLPARAAAYHERVRIVFGVSNGGADHGRSWR